jgi:FkbM family methyltransferase
LRAHSPASPESKQWLAEKPVALIATHNYAARLRDVASLLTQLGFTEIITPMEIYLHIGQELGWRYWLGARQVYAEAANRIEKAQTLWADADSERLFLETLLFRVGFELNALANPSKESVQYADPTVPRWKDPLRMVDGGAFTGDTLRSLLGHGYKFGAIHAFEPDLANFRKLRDSVPSLPPGAEISLWPCGISSSTSRLKFSEGGGVASKFSDSGTSEVPVVALDDVLHNQQVNLMKLDIEGGEMEALQGARKLIERYRPGLAVCLYHCPNHLWSIPLWVAELNLGYSLYYRAHGHSSFETVLYAIPK